MAARTKTTPKGLRLTLPGAPDTPHVVSGVPGLYRPSRPTPVGGDTDPLTLEAAEALDADPDVPLKLVDLTKAEADEARAAAEADVDESRNAVAGARRQARVEGSTPQEAERIVDEAAATNPTTSEED